MITGLRATVLAILLFAAVSGARAEGLVLEPGTASRLVLDKTFATVMLGDFRIVDVHTVGDRSVIIEALSPGTTNLVFIDERGMVTANIRVSVCDPTASGSCDAAASSETGGARRPASIPAPAPRQGGKA